MSSNKTRHGMEERTSFHSLMKSEFCIEAKSKIKTGRSSSSASALANEVFPVPGAPWKRYPRFQGIPLSLYQSSDLNQNLISSTKLTSSGESESRSRAFSDCGGPRSSKTNPKG